MLRLLSARANAGDKEALKQLQSLLVECPEVWGTTGNLTLYSERYWTDMIGNKDHLLGESVKLHLAQMKNELAETHPTRLEKLLIDQIGVAWLAAQHAEMAAAGPVSDSGAQSKFRLKQVESAERRLQDAIKTLTNLRARMPQGLAPMRPLRAYEQNRKVAT